MTKLTVTTPPVEEPVTLALAKDFLRLGHDGEDALISDLIASARARIEQESGIALIRQTVRADWIAWPAAPAGRGVSLPRRPALTLVSVIVSDAESAETDHSDRFRLECGRLALRPWSRLPVIADGGLASVTYEAGFGAASDLPEDLKEACLRLVSDLYTARTAPVERRALPEAVQSILNARREIRL